MKQIFFILIIAQSIIFSQTLDTNVFRYYPLNVGNRWVWYTNQNFFPGPSYTSQKIVRTLIANNHKYYVSERTVRIVIGGTTTSSLTCNRIDSVSGNLYSYDSASHLECLMDSLNSRKGDSAQLTCSNGWDRCDTLTYSIFGQNYRSKRFTWSNYFEAWGYKTYSLNIGMAYSFGQAVMSQTTITMLGCLINGSLSGDTNFLVGINLLSEEVPSQYSLYQNYPNPFNPATKIKFDIPTPLNPPFQKGGTGRGSVGLVKLIIYDILGRKVETLVNELLKPGTYEADWDASNFASGIYFYSLQTQLYTETKKMVVMK